MEIKYNKATSHRPKRDSLIDAALIANDLPAFVKQIKEERTWKESDRNAITVFKTNDLRIVVIALHKGAVMARHTAVGIISIQVLEGQIQFNTDRQTVELSKGQMLTLHESIPHSVFALRETIFLLTLTASLKVKSDHL